MDDPAQWAISYLSARGDAPWRWADDGDAVAWADGTTIVFREELASVLEWLVPHGWPPFGALVWLLAACRGKLPPTADRDSAREFPATDTDTEQLTLAAFHERLRTMQTTVDSGLAAVARLPESVRNSPRAKAVLAETVFARERAVETGQSLLREVVAVLRSGALTDSMLNQSDVPPPAAYGEFDALHRGLARLSPESLALRLRTGLDYLPRAATLPAAPAARARAMLAELRTDPEFTGLARLTRDFMAALQLPRLLSDLDEMPLGGFADLSNRGNLDRILLSELAHDDLTLAVRIALQEALYLRREPPAKEPPSSLVVLIDSGVRLWGVPRVLAAAVALALVGKSPQHGRLAVFRASGDTVVPVDPLTREGLVDHLSALETDAHPGPALPAFRRAVEDAGRHDAVLITQRDVVRDPAFQRSLAAAKFDALYLAVVDRDGSFELLRAPRFGIPICRAQVKVDDLVSVPSSDRSRYGLIDPAANPDLPLAFSISPFPLLIPVRGEVQSVVATGKESGLCTMRDRHLMRWTGRGRGASVVTSDLPRGATLWLGELPDRLIAAVKAHEGRRDVTCRIYEPEGALRHSHDWRLPHSVVRAEGHAGVLYLVFAAEARAHDLRSGAHLGTVAVSRRLGHGRYFQNAGVWCVLVWDGQRLRLEPVTLPETVEPGNAIRVFSRHGREGACCVTSGGDVFSENGTRVLQLGPLRDVAAVSADGEVLVVVSAKTGESKRVDLRHLGEPTSSSLSHPEPTPPTRSVRPSWRKMLVSPGRIRLVSKKGIVWELLCRNERLELSKGQAGRGEAEANFALLESKVPGIPSLKVAHFSDGRRAWLDGNAMLHLRCADIGRPEITLVLCDGGLAAWTSDGLWHGPQFFIGDHENAPASEIWERIRAFAI